MHLPEDGSKGVYLLEAYHQLHCLRILRKTMGEALTGQPFTWKPGAHIEHCFDRLLQVQISSLTPLRSYVHSLLKHLHSPVFPPTSSPSARRG